MFLKKLFFELSIFVVIASILWFFSNIGVTTSFLYGASVSFLSNTYSAYMLLEHQAKSLREETRRFYIAEFGKWSISVTLFALIFLNVDVSNPIVFFGAFIFANLITIFIHKFKT